MWIVWAAMAGATLSKGRSASCSRRVRSSSTRSSRATSALWRRLHLTSGVALFLVLTAPWFVAVSRANPEFLPFFFIHEHVERFLTDGAPAHRPLVLLRAPRARRQPAVARRARLRRAHAHGATADADADGFSWRRLALVWAAFVFVFFSLSGSKLPSYILPMFAPLALVAGDLLLRQAARARCRVRRSAGAIVMRRASRSALIFGYDLVVAAPRASADTPAAILEAYGPWLKAAVAVAARGAGAAVVAFRRAGIAPADRFWGIAVAGAVHARRGCRSPWPDSTRSPDALDIGYPAATAAARPGPSIPTRPFYQVGMYDQTLPFYLGRTTTLVAYRDELALGIDAEPQRQIPTIAAWIARVDARGRRATRLMPPDHVRSGSAADGVPMRVLARDPRRVIVEPADERRRAFAFLMTGVLLNAGAQLLLKAGTNALGVHHADARQLARTRCCGWRRSGTSSLGVACYVLSASFVWILGLSRVPVSVAYPMLSLGYVVNAIAAHYLFGEAVTVTRWLGIGFIVVGVWLVARS